MIADVYDSGVLPGRECYTRDILWTDERESLILVTRIQVHRLPEWSFAKVEMWLNGEWQQMDAIVWPDFWHDLPGYDRRTQERTRRRTRAISEELVQRLVRQPVAHAYG